MEQSKQDIETMFKMVTYERKKCVSCIEEKLIQPFLRTHRLELEKSEQKDQIVDKIIDCINAVFDRFKSRSLLIGVENPLANDEHIKSENVTVITHLQMIIPGAPSLENHQSSNLCTKMVPISQPNSDEQNQLPDMSRFDLKDSPVEEPITDYTEPVRRNTLNQSDNHADNVIPAVESKFQCDRCEKEFRSKNYMEYHRNKVHYDEFPLHCSRCRKGYFNEQEAQKHEALCTKIVHQCDACGHIANDRSVLDIHKRVHTREKPFECFIENCHSRFSQKSSLNLHLKTQHK